MKFLHVGLFLPHVSTTLWLIRCSEEFSFTSTRITCRSLWQRALEVGSNPAGGRRHGCLALVSYVFVVG
jgi:hypothetical protein